MEYRTSEAWMDRAFMAAVTVVCGLLGWFLIEVVTATHANTECISDTECAEQYPDRTPY